MRVGYVPRPTVALEKEKPRLRQQTGFQKRGFVGTLHFTPMKRDNAKKLLDAIGMAALVGFAGGVAKALAGLLITYLSQ
jgi:hypothetical protein